jgi:hypothetical protein
MSGNLLTLIYLLACLVLWIVPAVLFAYGFDLKRWDPDYVHQPHAQAEIREMYVRTGFWFLGSIICSLAIWLAYRL